MNRKTLTATRARINRQIEFQSLRLAELTKMVNHTNEIITANNESWPQDNDAAKALIAGPQATFYALQKARHNEALVDLQDSYVSLTNVNEAIAALGPVTRVKGKVQQTPAAAQLALL